LIWLLAPTLLALALGVALGGSPRAIFASRFRAWPAVLLAFAVELVLYNPPADRQPWVMHVGPWAWLAAQVVFFVVLITNGWAGNPRLVWPWRLAALGVGLNTLVIAFNGGHMPQSPQAALALWGASHIDPSRLQNVASMGADTRLPWLADVLAEPAWLPRPNILSVGDVLLASGVASWVFAATILQPRRDTMGYRITTRIDGGARPDEGGPQ
jgi:Family of unknown function (DUF5317)